VRIARHADRAVAAVAEVVGHGVVGRCAHVRENISTAASVVTVHMDGWGSGVGIAIDVAGAGTATQRAVVGAVVRRDVGAVAAEVATNGSSLSGKGAGQEDDGEGEFGQSFHSILFSGFPKCRRRSPPVLFGHSVGLSLTASQTGTSFLQGFAGFFSQTPFRGVRGGMSIEPAKSSGPLPRSRRREKQEQNRRLAMQAKRAQNAPAVMKTKANGMAKRVELGEFIVADSRICGGQPTFKGTRIMVWIVLEQIEDGMTWDEIVREWRGKVPKEAIAEAIAIADVVVKHEPFKGFHAGARRKPTRRSTAIAA
jgi:uncharacterized protein (DUF433 family)